VHLILGVDRISGPWASIGVVYPKNSRGYWRVQLHPKRPTPIGYSTPILQHNICNTCMIASKTPILFLYIRLFGIKIWLKVISYITLAALTLLMLVSIIVIGVVCTPHSEVVVPSSLLKCSLWSAHNSVACGILSLVVDIIILIIPLPVIYQLRLPIYKKVGLVSVFAFGIV
jgi:hypothetical protein